MPLEIPSLGRPFSLGMLYDAREERVIPGITLWNREDLARNISTTSQNNTEFEVLTSDSISDKFSALSISGELKISFWSGMVEVGGSAKYLTDTKESKTQARVTMKYRMITKFEQLSMNHLYHKNIPYQEVFDKGIATHVVTGILYGAQAFFVFDQKENKSENIKDIQGTIQGIIAKIGKLTGSVTMNDTEKDVVSQFSCKFHGDFALERNPTTYEEAVKTYASLPSLLGEDGEKAVPIKVWLYPLKNLEDSAAHLVQEISDHLMFMAEDLMQEISDVIMECNDMMRHPAAITFSALANKISKFKKLFELFRLVLQKKLSHVLSSVRSGNMEESSLREVLTMKKRSPFTDENIKTFLDRRKHEMEIVHSILKCLTNFKVVSERSELRKEILDPHFCCTICFNFSSLASEDSYLCHLESWLNKETWDFQDKFSDDTKKWFKQGIPYPIMDIIEAFKEKATGSSLYWFLVTAVECRDSPGITIKHYNNGVLRIHTINSP